MKSNPAAQDAPELSPIERRRKISVAEAARLAGLSEGSFRKHFAHLIRKLGLRRDVVELGHALDLPPPPRPP
jgi:predicted DNA-binding transcriptional regulator